MRRLAHWIRRAVDHKVANVAFAVAAALGAALAAPARVLADDTGAAAAPSLDASKLPPGIALVTVERRKVAVIDLTQGHTSHDGAAVAGRVLTEKLVQHPTLAPISDPAIAAALIGPLREEGQESLVSARRALTDANDAMARFELEVAAARALAGQAELDNVEPSAEMIELYADLAFVHGLSKLADSDGPAARSSFLLTQRLDPDRVLDPARYLPDVIAAYRQARRGGGGRMLIEIQGQGTAFVDGLEVGTAPLSVEVATGPHLIQLAGPLRLVRGSRAEITPTSPTVVAIAEARAEPSIVLARARRALVAAADEPARATAMASLARMVGVGDAIVLSADDGKLTAQTWRDRAPGFRPARPLVDPRQVDEVLSDLAPPSTMPRLTLPSTPRLDPPPAWYQKRWVQASMLTGAAMIAAAVVIGTIDFDEPTIGVSREPTF